MNNVHLHKAIKELLNEHSYTEILEKVHELGSPDFTKLQGICIICNGLGCSTCEGKEN
jgi:hypothetical protein